MRNNCLQRKKIDMRIATILLLVTFISVSSFGRKKPIDETKNIAINTKDYPEIELQDDTVKEGATWTPKIHGYPHASASSRLDLDHGENKMINGNTDDGWVSGKDSVFPQWIKIDLGKNKVFNCVKVQVPEPENAPTEYIIEVSSDNFDKDIRKVFSSNSKKKNFWNSIIKFRPVFASSIRLTATKGPKPEFSVNKFIIYPIVVATNINVWRYQPKKGGKNFTYANKDNIAFNPFDAPEGQWDPKIHGYPHVTASGFAKGRPGRASYYPHYVIDGEFIMARSWTHAFKKWWGNWLKIDFGKEVEFKYIKIFSSCMWVISGEPTRGYIPKKFDIEVSDDDFKKDIRKIFSAPPVKPTDVWNHRKDDTAKFIELPELTKARYIRFNFPKGQFPSQRLLIEQIEVYKNPPPNRKIEKKITNKPKLGKKIKAQVLVNNNDFTAWLEGSTRKVFKSDEVIISPPDPIVKISAARNEYEPFQIVVTPKKRLQNLRLDFSNLKMAGENEKQVISKNNLSWSPVGYVYIFDPSIVHVGGGRNIIGKVGDWPDPLLDQDKIDAEPGINCPLWITIQVPKDTVPGTYNGTIKIVTDDNTPTKINLALKVRSFALPDKQDNHFIRAANPGLRFLLPYYKVAFKNKWGQEELAKMVYRNLAKHRVNMLFAWPFPPEYQPKVTIKDGKVNIDLEKFGPLMTFLIDELGFKSIPFPTGQTHDILGSRSGFPWMGYPYMSDDYKKYLLGKDGFLDQMTKYFEKKGWLDNFYLEIWHEPQAGRNIDAWKEAYKLGTMIKKINKNIKLRIGGTCTEWNKTTPELFPLIDHWGVYLGAASLDHLHKLKNENKTRVTNCFNGFWLIDTAAINCRIMPWLLWKAGIDGYLHYGIFAYSNPWKNARSFPLANLSGSIRNGDNLFIYPQRKMNTEKPYVVDSIRWELEREGAEDYEYLWLLNDRIKKLEKLDRKGTYKNELNQAKDVLRQSENLVTDFGKANKDAEMKFEFEEDPKKLYMAREKIGDQIEKINNILKRLKK